MCLEIINSSQTKIATEEVTKPDAKVPPSQLFYFLMKHGKNDIARKVVSLTSVNWVDKSSYFRDKYLLPLL